MPTSHAPYRNWKTTFDVKLLRLVRTSCRPHSETWSVACSSAWTVVANISSISSSIDKLSMNQGMQSYMHVQNLMNSLWDIRIFLCLVPKESPCTSAANSTQHTFHSATTSETLQPLGTLQCSTASTNKEHKSCRSDFKIYPLEFLRRFSTVKFAATVRHPDSIMHGVQKYKFPNFINMKRLAQSV